MRHSQFFIGQFRRPVFHRRALPDRREHQHGRMPFDAFFAAGDDDTPISLMSLANMASRSAA